MNINRIIREKNLVIPLLGAPGTILSKTTLRENLTNSEVQYKTLSMLIDKFNPDGIFPMMDLTVEIEALGSEINFPENTNPSVAKPLIKNSEDLKILKGNWQGISGRMKVFIEVMEKIAKKYSIIKGGYVIGPFTMAGELMGANDIAMQAMLNPELVAELVNFSLEVISEYANALFNAGADAIAVLEPLAVILSPKKYKEFSLYPFKKLVSNLNNKPLILHIWAAYTILVAIYSFSSFLKLKNSSSIVESVGNLKGCPSNGGNSLGIIHITSLSTISTFAKNVPS